MKDFGRSRSIPLESRGRMPRPIDQAGLQARFFVEFVRDRCLSITTATGASGRHRRWKRADRIVSMRSRRWAWSRSSGPRDAEFRRFSTIRTGTSADSQPCTARNGRSCSADATRAIRPRRWSSASNANTSWPIASACRRHGRKSRVVRSGVASGKITVCPQPIEAWCGFRPPERKTPATGPLRTVFVGSMDMRKGFNISAASGTQVGSRSCTDRIFVGRATGDRGS